MMIMWRLFFEDKLLLLLLCLPHHTCPIKKEKRKKKREKMIYSWRQYLNHGRKEEDWGLPFSQFVFIYVCIVDRLGICLLQVTERCWSQTRCSAGAGGHVVFDLCCYFWSPMYGELCYVSFKHVELYVILLLIIHYIYLYIIIYINGS